MMQSLNRYLLTILLSLLFTSGYGHSVDAPISKQIRPEILESNEGSHAYEQATKLRKALKKVVREWYPRLRLMLWTPGEIPSDKKFTLKYKNISDTNPDAFAQADDDSIHIYDVYTQRDSNASGGLLIHEMVHMLQKPYRLSLSRWFSESIADYFRYSVYESWPLEKFLRITREAMNHFDGEPPKDRLDEHGNLKKSIEELQARVNCTEFITDPCNRFRKEGFMYTKDPVHAAGMFVMIDQLYSPGFVYQLHRKLFESTQSEDKKFYNTHASAFMQKLTGKSLSSLWCEYMALVEKRDVTEACPSDGWSWDESFPYIHW